MFSLVKYGIQTYIGVMTSYNYFIISSLMVNNYIRIL